MKITLINGQNHRGSTYHIGRMLAERLAGNDTIEEIFLPRDFPHFCTGCGQCFLKSETLCPHYAALLPLTKKLDGAELLIFTTPVYVYHTTGSMKAFLDHYGYRWLVHRPEPCMFHKQAVCIATAAGAGMKSACRDIADSLSFWGIPQIYTYGVAVRALHWEGVSPKIRGQIARRMEGLSKEILRRRGGLCPHPQGAGILSHHASLAKEGLERGGHQLLAHPWVGSTGSPLEKPTRCKAALVPTLLLSWTPCSPVP